jgi:hypothetical protein
MKNLIIALTVSTFITPFAQASIRSKDFIQCFEKALNERIQEIKDEAEVKGKKINICDRMSEKDKIRLIELYTKVGADSELRYYSASSMGAETVRFHFERLMWEVNCYEKPNNIFTAWGRGFSNAIGINKHTDIQLVEDTFSKMLGQDMWEENGADRFSDHDFAYCQE